MKTPEGKMLCEGFDGEALAQIAEEMERAFTFLIQQARIEGLPFAEAMKLVEDAVVFQTISVYLRREVISAL